MEVTEIIELHYLQVPFNNLPAGTPLMRVEPTSVHKAALRMVGNPHPCGYFRVVGEQNEDFTMMIPSFEGIVGWHHPNDKTVVGPFAAGEVTIDYDKLGGNKLFMLVATPEYPLVNIKVVAKPGLTKSELIVLSNNVPGYRLGVGDNVEELLVDLAVSVAVEGVFPFAEHVYIDESFKRLTGKVVNNDNYTYYYK